MASRLILLTVFLVLLAAWLTGLLRRFALRTQLLDLPNARSSHSQPMPRGGGVAIVVSFSLGLTVLWAWGYASTTLLSAVGGGGLAVATIGYLDDRFDLSARTRFFVQVLAAGWCLWWLGGFPPLPVLGYELQLGWLGAPVGVLFIVWMTNLYNFMDGIDGIAGVEAVTVAGGAALLLWCSGTVGQAAQLTLLTGAVLGFLVWNWPPAKIFMGDVGSGYLGFTLAAFAVAAAGAGVMLLWSWGILLGLFIVDATVTLLRRLLHGERVYQPHRSHAYQRLSRKLGGHLPVTLGVAAVNALWLLPWAFLAEAFPQWAWLCLVVSWMPLLMLTFWAGAGRPEPQKPVVSGANSL